MIDVNYNEYKETLEENMRLIPENHKLKEEIERLNNQLEEKTYLYNKLSTESKYTIEKLNNIITELEKWLKETQDGYIEEKLKYCDNQYLLDLTEERIYAYQDVLNKLKALKENSNDNK